MGDFFRQGKPGQRIYLSLEDRVATFTFAVKWDDTLMELNNDSIEEIALHEVCHLVIHRLMHLAGDRYTTIEQLREANEEVANVLTNFYLKNNKRC